MTIAGPLQEKNARRAPLSRKILLSSTIFIVVLIGMIIVISMLYLVEFNKISTMGIQIDELKKVRDNIIVENEVWNMRIASLKSLDVIQNQEIIRKMVNINEVEFLESEEKEK